MPQDVVGAMVLDTYRDMSMLKMAYASDVGEKG